MTFSRAHPHIWLAIFIPAFLCYLHSCQNPPPTNLQNVGGSSALIKILSSIQLNPTYQVVGPCIIVEEEASELEIESLFYLDGDPRNAVNEYQLRKTLRYPAEIVYRSDGTYKYHLSGTTWVHDVELGRGYLLISDSLNSGNIWRWEVGGGIITIGRSLFQKESGCRSNVWSNCPSQQFKSDNDDDSILHGSSGITVQSEKDAENFYVGNLIVAEKGERRIVRMEEDGARTPLATRVPQPQENGAEKSRRLVHPENLVYTPFGDLLFSDSDQYSEVDGEGGQNYHSTFAGLYRLKEIINIPSIPFQQSYDAHSWDNITHSSIELLYSNSQQNDNFGIPKDYGNLEYISSITSGIDYAHSVFIGMRTRLDGGIRKHIIMKVILIEEEEENDGSHTSGSLFFDMTFLFSANDDASTSVVVDSKGNVYATYPSGVAVIDSDGDLLVTIPFERQDSDVTALNSISFGHDGYLYVTSSNSLMRLRVKSLPITVPTNLIVPIRKKFNN